MWTIVSQPQAFEIFADERRAAGAVDVVVAEDRDPLAALRPRAVSRSVAASMSVRTKGSGIRSRKRRVEIALDRLGRDAAPGKHAGDQLVLAADLGDRERAHLPRPRRAAPATAGRAPRSRRRGNNFEKARRGFGPRKGDSFEGAMVDAAATNERVLRAGTAGAHRNFAPGRRPFFRFPLYSASRRAVAPKKTSAGQRGDPEARRPVGVDRRASGRPRPRPAPAPPTARRRRRAGA